MDKYVVWEIFSYAWTEIGIDGDEFNQLADQADLTIDDIPAVNRMFFKDVCLAFGLESFLVLPCMLWMLMPDWGFDKEWLHRRVDRWYGRPYFLNVLHPIRLLGYPVSLFFATGHLLKLRRAIRQNAKA